MKEKKLFKLIMVMMVIAGVYLTVTIVCKNSSITILDEHGTEYYKTDKKLKDMNKDSSESEMIVDNGFADSVISQVIDDMSVSLGVSKEKVIKELNNGQWVINSTIDIKLQEKIDTVFNERSIFTSRNNGDYNQSSMVVIDYSGNVKAVASGNNNDKMKNRATSTLLKVGSTIKPVAIYTQAVEEDLINFSSIIEDVPTITYYDGKAMEWPQNYDNKYEMNVTITDALQKSKNTIPVRVGKMVGENKIFEFLQNKVGYSTLVDNETSDNDKQLSALALGYFIKGVTLDTLVASYQIFGNGGYYSKPKLYTSVKDLDGNLILENKVVVEQVISEETATVMNRLLYNNINEENSIIKNANIDGVEVLGKTGTVGDGEDTISQLFVGMTPDYVAGVWCGYDNEKPLIYDSYNSPVKVWKSVMDGLEIKNSEFNLSNKVTKKEYCNLSGFLKTDSCKNIKVGYYKHSDILDVCNICK